MKREKVACRLFNLSIWSIEHITSFSVAYKLLSTFFFIFNHHVKSRWPLWPSVCLFVRLVCFMLPCLLCCIRIWCLSVWLVFNPLPGSPLLSMLYAYFKALFALGVFCPNNKSERERKQVRKSISRARHLEDGRRLINWKCNN